MALESPISVDLVAVLRLAWTAGILTFVAPALPIPLARGPFRRLVDSFAGRGKTLNARKLTVPQRFFLHFYVVGFVLTSCFLLVMWFYAYKTMTALSVIPANHSSHGISGAALEDTYHICRTVFILLMMDIHVVRRLYESAIVFNYSSSARMHVMGYLVGILFYVAAPLSLGSLCIFEALAFLRSQRSEFILKNNRRILDIDVDWMTLLKTLLILGWCQWFGIAIFLWGSLHQLRCHSILGALRKHMGADEYMIPLGDWFNYVSCPHYLAEIVIYAGILVASGGTDLTIWLLLIFVIVNLSYAAADTHKWYHQKFEDYPQSRRAIIPFVY